MLNKFIILLSLLVVTASTSAYSSAALNESILIAGVVEQDGLIQIFINSREVWQTDHTLVDSYSDEEMVLVDEITDKLNLCNLMESTYEPCKEGRTPHQIRAELNSIGVEVNPQFEAWITKEVSGNPK
jgi:hypothetical protein